MIQLATKISEYLRALNNVSPLENIYSYEFNINRLPIEINFQNINTSFQRNIELKNRLHQIWLNSNQELKGNIIEYYIKIWGGIRGNSPETMEFYRTATTEALLNGPFGRISSWSKALVIHNPMRFLIYDSRVAISLNCLQARFNLENEEKIRFVIPQPNVRNGHPRRQVINQFQNENCNNYNFWLNVNVETQYYTYLELLEQVQINSGFDKCLIEMVLFQITDQLCDEHLRNRY
jgi:hypothetical protein